jgi:hypothetical protein
LVETKEYTHWPIAERILDAMWVGLLIFGGLKGIPSLGHAKDADPLTNLNTVIVYIVLLVALSLLLIMRKSRHRIQKKGNVVTYSSYRVFGLIPTITKVFDVNELGLLVLDTERRCDCCNPAGCFMGFLGIYVTKGFPTFEKPIEVAFEIPIIYNSWQKMTAGCALGCYESSFKAINNVLGFQYFGSEGYTQTTTVTGGTWDQNMAADFQAKFDDSMATYLNKFCINRAALPAGSHRFERVNGGRPDRAVYQMIST